MVDSAPVELFDPDTDIGRCYAAVDWANSPVGPPEAWPDSLRAAFSMMVSSRFAMWMAWGPELTFFCNDTYRRETLGRKYPWALGRPAAQVWAEIWPDIGPLIEAVLAGRGATWDEGLQLFLERSGFVEETYHTFSYSPLIGDDAAIAGMLCVVSEDTGRVLGERRIGALSALASGLSDASSAAEVFAAAETRLPLDPYDLPFVAGYLLDAGDDAGPTARLAFASGIPVGHEVAPAAFAPGDGSTPWAAHWPADGTPVVVEDLAGLFAELPTGGWSTPPQHAVVAPLRTGEQSQVAGALVVGMNPHRVVDPDVVAFVTLIAGQLSAAITRGRAFDAERERAEQMAALDRAKTTFFTNVSHELRTPLTLLLGPAEDALADTTTPLPASQRRRIEVVHRNAERLLKLVNTLLDFSRLESGRTQGRFEPVALDRLTAELVSMFESAFGRAGLTLSVDCPPLPEPVYVDREMWAKIVLNLLSNALKATFTGGVDVRLTAEPGGVRLSVHDTGVGIDRDEQAQLFERFHRVSGARLRTHEGSGIGLALVAELAALHGGRVGVTSRPGQGSTFTVTVPTGSAHLPAEQVVDAPAGGVTGEALGRGYLAEAARWLAAGPDAGASAGPAAAGGPRDDSVRRVLVVDDNADMRDYVRDVLAAEFRVDTAADGVQGLARAVADPPDLVLTDVMMPVLDGFGLLRALREDPGTAHIPVVMLSARSGDESAVEGLEAGADDYLVKPFSHRELLARVRANLELDRVRRVAEELARSQGMLAHAEELAQVGSFEYDADSAVLRGTPQFFRLAGIEPGTPPARGDVLPFGVMSGGDRERLQAAVRRALDADLRTGGDLDLEFGVGAGTGHRLLWLRAVVERGPDGMPERLRGSVQDITARVAAQAAAEAEAAAREVAAREHEIAVELQQSLLPRRTFDADHLDLAAFYRAGVEGTQVGGDWYDVIDLDAGRTALVLGDVMGRGIQAATVMGQLRAAVRAYARIELAPDVLMQLLDDAVRDIRADMIVTCVYAVYDPTDQSFTYANAGHLPPLLVTPDGAARRLVEGGPPLGAGRDTIRPETITLPAGALLALYTDGLVERRGEDVDVGIDQLAQLLTSAPADLAAVPAYLTDALLPAGPEDDVALLVARVSDRASTDRVVVREVPSDLAAVGAARDLAAGCVADWGGTERLVEDVRLIVSELVTNAILHGGPPVQLRIRKGGRRLLVEVHDGTLSSPQLRRAAPNDNHGRGLMIVSLLSERWGTRPTPNGKSVWCQLRLA